MPVITVIGAGYVGLVTAAGLAQLGHSVHVVETDEQRLTTLLRGAVPIYEPGLDGLIAEHRASGRLRFTRSHHDAIPGSEFAFIAVNTPSSPDGNADISFVLAALRSVLDAARPGLAIVIKSTVPVGTGDLLAEIAAMSGIPGVEVVSNPEFLREGSAVSDFLAPDRIVVGAESERAGNRVAGLYRSIEAPLFLCRRRSAELAKYAANAALALRISFINEIAGVCASAGADVEEIARIVGADRRIGSAFLNAGLGWGGSCFPKDVRALIATAASHGRPVPILEGTLDVNLRQRHLAFKPGSDDIREAPALDIIGRLIEDGIHVRAHDPVAMANARRSLPNIRYCADAYDVAAGSDAILLATEWPEYLDLDWAAIRARMRGNAVVDGRHVLDPEHLAAVGLDCYRIADALPATQPSAR